MGTDHPILSELVAAMACMPCSSARSTISSDRSSARQMLAINDRPSALRLLTFCIALTQHHDPATCQVDHVILWIFGAVIGKTFPIPGPLAMLTGRRPYSCFFPEILTWFHGSLAARSHQPLDTLEKPARPAVVQSLGSAVPNASTSNDPDEERQRQCARSARY